MWWLAFLAILVAFAMAIWRWGAVLAVISLVALTAFFQASSAFYLLPLGYYKDGGDGTFAFNPAWVFHAAFWTVVVLLAALCGKLLRKGLVR